MNTQVKPRTIAQVLRALGYKKADSNYDPGYSWQRDHLTNGILVTYRPTGRFGNFTSDPNAVEDFYRNASNAFTERGYKVQRIIGGLVVLASN